MNKNGVICVRISILLSVFLFIVATILITYNTQLENELSVAEDELSIAKDELSIAKDELSIAKDELLVTKNELSVAEEEISVAEDELLAVKKEISRVAEEKIIYEYRDTIEGVKEIKTKKYSVSKREYIEGEEIEIIYPEIEIFENKELSEKINKIFYDAVIPVDETIDWISNYPGAIYMGADYTITYFDSDIISMHSNAYVTTGGPAAGGSQGLTVSLDDGEILMLDSFDITIKDLIHAMNNEIVYMSMTIDMLQNDIEFIDYKDPNRYYEDGFSIITQVNDLHTNEYDNFFLDSDGVYVIIDTSPLRAKATGYMKIAYDWKGNIN